VVATGAMKILFLFLVDLAKYIGMAVQTMVNVNRVLL
jgi:hypothetical protein